MVMEGVSGVGAVILHFKPALVAALTVEFPKTAMRVLFCLKSGKFHDQTTQHDIDQDSRD